MCWGYGMDGYCIRVSRVYRLPPVFFRGAGTHTTIDTTKHTINTLTHESRHSVHTGSTDEPPGDVNPHRQSPNQKPDSRPMHSLDAKP
jgi:hypothetical protein